MPAVSGSRQRRADFFERLGGRADYAVISSPHNVMYFSGLWTDPNSLNGSSLPILIFDAGNSRLFVDNFLAGEAGNCDVDEVVEFPWYESRYPVRDRRRLVMHGAAEWLEKAGPKDLAVEMSYLPADLVARLAGGRTVMHEASPVIENMRYRKYPDEIETIREILSDASAAMDTVRRSIRAGMTEWSVFGLLYQEFVILSKNPASMIADIITDGRRAGVPRDRALRSGDLVIMDFSPHTKGYRADIATTVCVESEPSGRQKEYMEILLEAQHRAESLLAPGVQGRVVYAALAEFFASRGVGEYFTSHAGHGLGLLHPERPYIVSNCEESLAPGSIVTLEPGLYNREVGHIRIEDAYLVVSGGFEKLTNHKQGF